MNNIKIILYIYIYVYITNNTVHKCFFILFYFIKTQEGNHDPKIGIDYYKERKKI